MPLTGHRPTGGPRTSPSSSFDRALDRFTNSLTAKQRQEFTSCSLKDVYDSIVAIQNTQGSHNGMRDMARIQAFLEGMDEYRKVVEAFLNCTPFMGYVWGPIRFILLATNTWVTSLDVILNAYQQIQERLPSFMQYQVLFDKNPEMRRALELYFCDILEFHYNALRFLTRPGWKKLFASFWKTFETRFRCILDSLSRHKDLIESEKSTVTLFEAQRMRELAESHIRDMEDVEKKKQLSVVLEKLEAPNYQIDQYAASEQRRNSRSGDWILRDDMFREWADPHASKNPLLYINGIPGAGMNLLSDFFPKLADRVSKGKTTLVSQIIEVLLENVTFPALFFYCKNDVPTKNNFTSIIRALLAQLSCKDKIVASYLYEKCCTRDQAGVLAMLEEVAEVVFDNQATTFIVLDGLDECEPQEVQKILSWLIARQKDIRSTDHGHVRLLCVGQRTEVIQRLLSKASQISLENPEHQNDVRKFIEQQAGCIRDEFDIGFEVEAEIVRRVSTTAKSMFLFAKLVMENFLNQTSQHDLLKEMEPSVFPVDLKNAYERVVATVYKKGPQRAAAVRIIEWVACAKRPLRWGEVQATFFIDPQAGTSDFQGRKLRKTCKRLCGSLIEVSKDDNRPEAEAVLTLVHDTARDYLQKTGMLNLPSQNAKMALYCVDYLFSQPFNPIITEKELKEFSAKGYYAFLYYAASYWLDHLLVGIDQNLDSDASVGLYDRLAIRVKLFLQKTHILDQYNLVMLDYDYSRLFEIVDDIPRDVAARNQWVQLEWQISRIMRTMETLAEDLQNNSASTLRHSMLAIYGTTEYKCSKLGCVHFQDGFGSRSQRDTHLDRHRRPFLCTELYCPFQLLGFPDETGLKRHLSRNHRSEEENSQYSFPRLTRTKNGNIINAAMTGDIDTVRRLISSGERVKTMGADRFPEELLELAARHGHLDICKLLVEKGTYINVSVLHSAVARDDLEMVHYFLSLDKVSPNHRDSDSMSMLHVAVTYDAQEAVKLILDRKDVELDIEDGLGKTPFHLAVQRNNLEIVKLLLATGKVDPNSEGNSGGSPLSIAAAFGNTMVASALLATGKVDPDGRIGDDDTPLLVAARERMTGMVQMLLATERVDPDARNRWGETPLMAASKNNSDKIVSMLLCTGKVDPNAVDIKGNTLLWWATVNKNVAVIKLLLEHSDIRPDPKTELGRTPLMEAITRGSVEIVTMLLATERVDVNAIDEEEHTPLIIASGNGNEAIVKILLDTRKFDVSAKDMHWRTAMTNAKIAKAEGVVRLLRASALADYQWVLMLLEKLKKERLAKARMEH